ncbi:MAG TPA: hypothetical protein VMF06_11880 [Candidatus Limnocylindria bacterium]|jgi:hypothetical protein|nr:hypothetical protein [Candidatus Limnocylindria bacterium]
MTTFLDKLNLSPFERRLVIVGLVVFALLINYFAIWPYFSDWGVLSREWSKQESRRTVFMSEIGKLSTYESQMKQLERAGAQVVPEEQANRLQTTVITAAQAHSVYITKITPTILPARMANQQTNQFFDEQVLAVDLLAKEEPLVNFLYALGSGDSMIRVREITGLRLDPTQMQLTAHLTLVASFQKKARPASAPSTQPARPAGPSPTTPKPAGGPPQKSGGSTNKTAKKI